MLSIFKGGILQAIESDDETQEKLLDYLPNNQRNKEDLIANLKSPQFTQSLKQLEKLLTSQDSKNILISLGIYNEAIFNSSESPIDAFIKLIINKYKE